jgi:hypothetical protein
MGKYAFLPWAVKNQMSVQYTENGAEGLTAMLVIVE